MDKPLLLVVVFLSLLVVFIPLLLVLRARASRGAPRSARQRRDDDVLEDGP